MDLVIIGKYLKVWYVIKGGDASSDMLLNCRKAHDSLATVHCCQWMLLSVMMNRI